MKKIILLSIAFLSFATIFSSCTDEDSKDDKTKTAAISLKVSEIKSFVGQSNDAVSSTITAKGYTLSQSQVEENGATTYAYSSTSGSACTLMEYDNIIFSAAFIVVGTDQSSLLSSYKTLSNEAYSIYSSTAIDYSNTIFTSEPQEYTSHQNFMTALNSATGIITSMETYNKLNQDHMPIYSTALMYMSGDMPSMKSKGFGSTSVTHTDYTIPSPLSFK
ncbi:MAG: hypothetical protein WC135_01485 [Bacteroidales bacterium]